MILITGGTGFLGRHLVPALHNTGVCLRVLTRSPEANPWLQNYENVEVFAGDLRDVENLQEAVDGCDTIIHAAGLFSFWGDASDFRDTNVIGTDNLLRCAVNANISKIIFISSAAVIGNPNPDAIIDETYPPQPADPYQQSKLESEKVCLGYYREYNLPIVILRPGAFYGPMGEYAFNRLFFTDPMRGIIMQVDGGNYIIFPVFITDVVQGILQALEKGQAGEIYHICGEWITHKEAFDIVCEEAQLWYPRLRIPGWLGIGFSKFLTGLAKIIQHEPFYPINLKSYVYNNWRISSEKAKQELGFEPTDFREGAKRTIEWYRAGKPDIFLDDS